MHFFCKMHVVNEKSIDGVNKSKAGLLDLHACWPGIPPVFPEPLYSLILDLITSPWDFFYFSVCLCH